MLADRVSVDITTATIAKSTQILALVVPAIFRKVVVCSWYLLWLIHKSGGHTAWITVLRVNELLSLAQSV